MAHRHSLRRLAVLIRVGRPGRRIAPGRSVQEELILRRLTTGARSPESKYLMPRYENSFLGIWACNTIFECWNIQFDWRALCKTRCAVLRPTSFRRLHTPQELQLLSCWKAESFQRAS